MVNSNLSLPGVSPADCFGIGRLFFINIFGLRGLMKDLKSNNARKVQKDRIAVER